MALISPYCYLPVGEYICLIGESLEQQVTLEENKYMYTYQIDDEWICQEVVGLLQVRNGKNLYYYHLKYQILKNLFYFLGSSPPSRRFMAAVSGFQT